jgi:hypothetical protein
MLTDKRQADWAAPTTIFKHCPVFNTPKTDEANPAKRSAMTPMREANIALQEQNHKLQKELIRRSDGDQFKPTDKARDIAVVLVGMLTRTSSRNSSVN